MRFKQWALDFLREEDGATVVEYAVMLVLIILVALVTIRVVGNQVENGFNRVSDALYS